MSAKESRPGQVTEATELARDDQAHSTRCVRASWSPSFAAAVDNYETGYVDSCMGTEVDPNRPTTADQAAYLGYLADVADEARIAAWEDTPLDPDDDLSIIASYPAEVTRLRAEQKDIRRDPVYVIANHIGGETRAAYLWARARDEGDEFYTDDICRCPYVQLGDLEDWFDDDGDYVVTCGWCQVRAVAEMRRDAQVALEMERRMGIAPRRDSTLTKLRNALRGGR